jgi:hypothetical protein
MSDCDRGENGRRNGGFERWERGDKEAGKERDITYYIASPVSLLVAGVPSEELQKDDADADDVCPDTRDWHWHCAHASA